MAEGFLADFSTPPRSLTLRLRVVVHSLLKNPEKIKTMFLLVKGNLGIIFVVILGVLKQIVVVPTKNPKGYSPRSQKKKAKINPKP